MTATRDARRDIPNLETYSGLYLNYADPWPEQIELADIARGLSQVCRFGGQTTVYYSVAEHAIFVSELVVEAGHPELALAALHHDSHEAYLGDWPSPLKYVIAQADETLLKSLCVHIDAAIAERFRMDATDMWEPVVKQADIEAMRREAATLKWSHGTGPHWGWDDAVKPLAGIGWSPTKAEREFLKTHRRLTQ